MDAAETEKWTPKATFPYFLNSSRNRPVDAIFVTERGEREREREGEGEKEMKRSRGKTERRVFLGF